MFNTFTGGWSRYYFEWWKDGFYRVYEWVMSHKWVMSGIWMSHVTCRTHSQGGGHGTVWNGGAHLVRDSRWLFLASDACSYFGRVSVHHPFICHLDIYECTSLIHITDAWSYFECVSVHNTLHVYMNANMYYGMQILYVYLYILWMPHTCI